VGHQRPEDAAITAPVAECTRCHTPLPGGSRFCFACGTDQSGGAEPVGATETLQLRLTRVVEGKYEVQRLLGRGGMGAVFLAKDVALDRDVAIKVLPPEMTADTKLMQRFQSEARTAAKLDHTNIIPIYRVESEGGLHYFVMKYIAGTSLEDVLDEKKPLPWDYVQRVLWEAACALGHAHQRGVVHRDVKPANIMFDHDGRVMLTDFGISKGLQAASAGLTGTGMIIGTPHYMAPEQAKGQTVDGRADQYALGVVGYRLITRQLPFGGDSVHTILYKHIFEEPPPARDLRPDIPPFLAAAVHRAMAKDPAQRFATMEEFASAVWPEQPVAAGHSGPITGRRPNPALSAEVPTERVMTPPAISGRRPAPRPARPPEKSRGGLGIALFFLIVTGGGAAAWWFLLGPGKSVPPPAAAPVPTAAPPAAPAPPVVVDVRVTPATAQLLVGGGAALQAQPVDAQGQPVAGAQVMWTSTAPQVARVDATGRVTALAAGLAMIEARAGAARGQAAIQVAAPAPRAAPPPRVATQTPSQPPPVVAQYGYVSINATPAATVFINGVNVGETPIGNYRVPVGAVTIRLEAPGYRTVTDRVTVEAGETVPRRYPLTPEG